MFAVTLLMIVSIGIGFGQEEIQWGYTGETGPKYWPTLFPTYCAGKMQSPVNINKCSVERNAELDPFEFINYDTPIEKFTIENTGKTIDVFPPPGIAIKGGGLGAKYNLVQCHFHWSLNLKGSEHTINGHQLALEIHCVHSLNRTESLAEAAAFAVLGGLYEVSSCNNNDFIKEIVKNLGEVREAHGEFEVEVDSTKPLSFSMLLPENRDSYYRYNGSLTTPICNETVVWTIFTEIQKITCSQLAEFRKVQNHDGEPLTHNFRPTQPLNGRTVQRSRDSSFWDHFFILCLL